MTGVRLGLGVMFVLLLQLTVVDRMAILGVRPDLTVLLLVMLSVRRGPVAGTLVGFGLGILQDLLVLPTLGMNMLAKCIVGYAVGKLSQNLVVSSALHILLVALSVLLHDLVFLLAYTGLDLPRFLAMFVSHAVPTALYTAIVGVLVVGVASALSGGRFLSAGEEGGLGRG